MNVEKIIKFVASTGSISSFECWFHWFWVRGFSPFSMLRTCPLDLLRRRESDDWPEEVNSLVKTWVKSKSGMTFVNLAFFFRYGFRRCICRLICPIPSMESGSKVRNRRLMHHFFCIQVVKLGSLKLPNFCPYLHEFKVFFYFFLAAVTDLDFTLLIC